MDIFGRPLFCLSDEPMKNTHTVNVCFSTVVNESSHVQCQGIRFFQSGGGQDGVNGLPWPP